MRSIHGEPSSKLYRSLPLSLNACVYRSEGFPRTGLFNPWARWGVGGGLVVGKSSVSSSSRVVVAPTGPEILRQRLNNSSRITHKFVSNALHETKTQQNHVFPTLAVFFSVGFPEAPLQSFLKMIPLTSLSEKKSCNINPNCIHLYNLALF